MMNKIKKKLEEKLKKANEKIKLLNTKVLLVIVGGAAFIIKGLTPRSTYDIDYINRIDKKLSNILNMFQINNRAITYETTFGNWNDDLEEVDLFQLSNIELKTISTERLLVSRLFSKKRFDDFKYAFLKNKINKNKFEQILEEIFSFSDPVFINEWNQNKSELEKLYKVKRWNYEKSVIKKLCEK